MTIDLELVRLAFECPLRWEKLSRMAIGLPAVEDTQRFCGECKKHVHNLSALTRDDAEAVLARAELENAPICVRVEVDALGRSVHAPHLLLGEKPAPPSKSGRLGATLLIAGLSACAPGTDSDSAGDAMAASEMQGQARMIPEMDAVEAPVEHLGEMMGGPRPMMGSPVAPPAPIPAAPTAPVLMGRVPTPTMK